MADEILIHKQMQLKQQLALANLLTAEFESINFAEFAALGKALIEQELVQGELNKQQQAYLIKLEAIANQEQIKEQLKRLNIETVQELAKQVYQLSAKQEQTPKVNWQARAMISLLWAVPLSTLASGFFDPLGLNIALMVIGFVGGVVYSFYNQKQAHDGFSKNYQSEILKRNIIAEYNKELFASNADLLLSSLTNREGEKFLTSNEREQIVIQLKQKLEESNNYKMVYQDLFTYCLNKFPNQDTSSELSKLVDELKELLPEEELEKEENYGWRFWQYPWMTKKVWVETILIGAISSASTVFGGYIGFFAGVAGVTTPYLLIGLGIAVTLALLAVAVYAEYREHTVSSQLDRITNQRKQAKSIGKQQEDLRKTVWRFCKLRDTNRQPKQSAFSIKTRKLARSTRLNRRYKVSLSALIARNKRKLKAISDKQTPTINTFEVTTSTHKS